MVDLLSNEKLIEEERENAKKIRERLAGTMNYIFFKLLEVWEQLEAILVIKDIVQILIKIIIMNPIIKVMEAMIPIKDMEMTLQIN